MEPSRVLQIPGTEENESLQQYVEIGSNVYLGTRDGMKYTLLQTLDNRFKLIESSENISIDQNSSKSSFCVSKEDISTETRDTSEEAAKLVSLKSESTPCKGQGDEIRNAVLSISNSFMTFLEPENVPSEVLVEEKQIQMETSNQLTYTTLSSKSYTPTDIHSTAYSPPNYSLYTSTPSRPLGLGKKPVRFVRRPKIQMISPNTPYSPIPRPRGSTRQRRPRQSWHYPQVQRRQSTSSVASDQTFPSSLLTKEPSSGNLEVFCRKSDSSGEFPRVPNNTPNSSESSSLSSNEKTTSLKWLPCTSGAEGFIEMDPRESHNEKERKRRLRIKNACQHMKSLLPCMSDKTDNASVFEHAVHFITFMRQTIGNEGDMEFLEEICEY